MATTFETNTAYAIVAGNGGTITLKRAAFLVSLESQGGTFWYRIRTPSDAAWTPADPFTGKATTVIAGWARIIDGDSAVFGSDMTLVTRHNFPDDFVIGINYWCEANGSLVSVSRG